MKVTNRIKEGDLIDFYGCLLTDHQQNVLYDYYFNDLSMNEIAENCNVSKSAISDLIKRSLNQLYLYEEKLHLVANSKKRNTIIESLFKSDDAKVVALANKLKDIE